MGVTSPRATPSGERVFIRALASEPVWQTFLPRATVPESATIKQVEITRLIQEKPGFLNFAGESSAPFRVALPLNKLLNARSPVMVAVAESGGIFIVGCPDESGADAYTTLVADMLAASTRLWRMDYEKFSNLFVESDGVSLEELMLERSRADWDFDQFQSVVTENLERGRFPMLIVTVLPEGEVKQVIDYLNGMNLRAQLLSYSIIVRGGIMVVRPLSIKDEFARQPGEIKAESVFTTGYGSGAGAGTGTGTTVEIKPRQEEVAPEVPPLEEKTEEPQQPPSRIPLGAMPTEPAKKVARPPGPGTKPGVMSGKRPPPGSKKEK